MFILKGNPNGESPSSANPVLARERQDKRPREYTCVLSHHLLLTHSQINDAQPMFEDSDDEECLPTKQVPCLLTTRFLLHVSKTTLSLPPKSEDGMFEMFSDVGFGEKVESMERGVIAEQKIDNYDEGVKPIETTQTVGGDVAQKEDGTDEGDEKVKAFVSDAMDTNN
jgi:hypothetical protein